MTTTPATEDAHLRAAAERALELVRPGDKLGLGTGHAASVFIAALGERVQRDGLTVVGVATSEATARQARELGIPLADLGEAGELDLMVDGADEVAPNLDLIKGRGGAFVRERIVAAAARRQVIIVGADKLVAALGERGAIPIEVNPMAVALVTRSLERLDMRTAVRQVDERPFVTSNSNLIIDAVPAAPLADPRDARELHRTIRDMIGVVDTGLFLGTAERVLVGHPDGHVETLVRAAPAFDG